jgi:two-component system, chemotaxis family, protein-glutamate methylesterase/glutaminase
MTAPLFPPTRAQPQQARATTAYDAIVVGGSSGAIDALARLVPALPATLRAAVLVVVHLPRDRRSLLADIFRQRCALPLREAQDKDPIAPGTVYFAPPDYHLLVDAGPSLALSVDAPVHYSRPSIDVLFESAADQYGERLVGILLSGANEDGARGMEAVAAAGGLVVVQDPATAPMPAMPQAALARVATPHVLPPPGIADLLTGWHHQGLL